MSNEPRDEVCGGHRRRRRRRGGADGSRCLGRQRRSNGGAVKGDYYALWFVGPGDSAQSPNRISAVTFHPDPDGGSRVRFAAAVDPAKYPVLAVTVEKGDGDPAPTLPDVLRSPAGR